MSRTEFDVFKCGQLFYTGEKSTRVDFCFFSDISINFMKFWELKCAPWNPFMLMPSSLHVQPFRRSIPTFLSEVPSGKTVNCWPGRSPMILRPSGTTAKPITSFTSAKTAPTSKAKAKAKAKAGTGNPRALMKMAMQCCAARTGGVPSPSSANCHTRPTNNHTGAFAMLFSIGTENRRTIENSRTDP